MSFLNGTFVFLSVYFEPSFEFLDVVLMPFVRVYPLMGEPYPETLLTDNNDPGLFYFRKGLDALLLRFPADHDYERSGLLLELQHL